MSWMLPGESARRTTQPVPRPERATSAPHQTAPAKPQRHWPLLQLQQLAGNRATATLVQRQRDGHEQAVAADAAAQGIINWIIDNPPAGQAVNYCVGVLSNNDLMISKVSGVTTRTGYLTNLAAYIRQQHYEVGRDIRLAQQFNTAVGSNHAEMCIMAAAGAGQVTSIYCSGPHCGFCAAVMAAHGVTLGAAQGNDQQQGWTHPFAPLAYGSQLTATTGDQLAELQGLPPAPTRDHVRVGSWLTSAPEPDKSTPWL